jgi:hypothetical protein
VGVGVGVGVGVAVGARVEVGVGVAADKVTWTLSRKESTESVINDISLNVTVVALVSAVNEKVRWV